jgi:hypothetical protein
VLQPAPPGLLIGPEPQTLVAREVGFVQPLRVNPVHAHKEVLHHVYCLPLEVPAVEAPAPEHLKEGVAVRVPPHLVEVVVISPGPDALLGIRIHGEAGQVGPRRYPPKKDGELVQCWGGGRVSGSGDSV